MITAEDRLHQRISDLRHLVAELRHQNAELDRQVETLQMALLESRTDSLTGLHNRRWLDEQTSPNLSAVLVVDMDNLKQINDQHGHSAGDRAIVHVASTLRRRSVDAVRLGGDEFVVLVPRGNDPDFCADVVLSEAHWPIPVRNGEVAVTVSIGMCRCESSEGLQDLIERADQAMYAAKRAGGDRLVVA